LQRGTSRIEPLADDYPFEEVAVFERPGLPRMHFIVGCPMMRSSARI
jgi:tRNA (mo5U34)-methyltransferase